METKTMKEGLGLLRVAFRKDFDQETASLYSSMLMDLPEENFVQAIKELLNTSRFLPSIAEIREKAGASSQDDALDAWELAAKALKGDVAVKDLPEPIKRALVSVCPDIRMVQSSELKWIRNDFIKTYPSMKRRENLKLLREHPEIKFLED